MERAITRYDQKIKKYPLNKLHNYVIDYSSVESVRKKLSKLTPSEISNIDAIGNNRAFTISAGSFVVTLLMKKLGFKKLIVSIHGLREGFLSEYVINPTSIQFASSFSNPVRQFTLEAREEVERANKVLYLVTDPISEIWIKKLNTNSESLMDSYVEGKYRPDIYKDMTERILRYLREN